LSYAPIYKIMFHFGCPTLDTWHYENLLPFMKAHRSQLLPVLLFALAISAGAQAPATRPEDNGAQSAAGAAGRTDPNTKGSTTPNTVEGSAGPDVKHGAADSDADQSFKLPSIAPTPAPPNTNGRPRIGLALGGGGALGLSEIGVLQWLEDHHIPVDVIAGTSMGCMVSALYSTGKSPDELKTVMNDTVFNSVFTFGTKFQTRSFRRREDDRALPNSLSIGLKHGVSLRNSVLTDQGLNAFLDREFLRYDDRIDFNTLPIPLRCVSTDVTAARSVTFSNGSLPDAVRASISIPGVFRPFGIGGHQFVDGAVLNNLPTQTIHEMKADVVLAVSLPIAPLGKEDLNSLLGVLQRSFGVAIEGNERESRRLADVVMVPDVSGFNQTAYLKGADLAKRGYQAAELHKDQLLKYAVNDQQWQAYLSQRAARLRGPAGRLQQVVVKAPNDDVTRAVQRKFAAMVGQPVNTKAIEAALDEIRSDGRYDADYTVGHAEGESSASIQNLDPVIRVAVTDKTTGPPFLLVGANIEAQTSGVTRATLESIFLDQDLGGYGSELRGNIKVGFLTQIDAEYYRRIRSTGHMGGFFVAPHGGILRNPFDIYVHQVKISERLLQNTGGGVDAGWSDSRKQEVRLGWEGNQVRWQTQIGADTFAPTNLIGGMQRVRLRYVFDNQDRALVPQYGVRITTEVAYLYSAVSSANTPVFTNQFALAHQIGKNLFLFQSLAGTMLHRNVSQPFLFTLGGPQRLSASAIDEYRGTDYFLLEPVFLRRLAKLPDPLGQSIYAGIGYEAGQMRAPGTNTQTRQDIYFGIVAETPLGVITLAPAIGDDGHRKFVFTLGKLF
jgi:NTE family protein